jgi:hypothetical protein
MIAVRLLPTIAVAATSIAIVSGELSWAQSQPRQADQPQIAGRFTEQDYARAIRHRTRKKRGAASQGDVSRFNGSWSVTLSGSTGLCAGRSLSYVVQVRNGVISYRGGDGTVSGRVSPSGAASAHIVSGDRVGNTSGHLSGRSGSGSWRGQAGGTQCSGTWSARR